MVGDMVKFIVNKLSQPNEFISVCVYTPLVGYTSEFSVYELQLTGFIVAVLKLFTINITEDTLSHPAAALNVWVYIPAVL